MRLLQDAYAQPQSNVTQGGRNRAARDVMKLLDASGGEWTYKNDHLYRPDGSEVHNTNPPYHPLPEGPAARALLPASGKATTSTTTTTTKKNGKTIAAGTAKGASETASTGTLSQTTTGGTKTPPATTTAATGATKTTSTSLTSATGGTKAGTTP